MKLPSVWWEISTTYRLFAFALFSSKNTFVPLVITRTPNVGVLVIILHLLIRLGLRGSYFPPPMTDVNHFHNE